MAQQPSAAFTRRTFIGVAGGVAASTLLAACTRAGSASTSGSGGGTLKFWNMPWGNTEFLTEDKKIVAGFSKNGYKASYEQIQWANFTTEFATGLSSNTGPAVSSGGGTQAFEFAHEGKIQYADDLIASWANNGLKDDFLPNLLDTMKTKQGYAAIPYNLDCRVAWYNKTLFDQYDIQVPTTWAEYKTVCATLKQHGMYGFGVGAGSGNSIGFHTITGFMINNGGGWFNANQEPAADTPANEEAIEFIIELVQNGYSDPRAAGYTNQNVYTEWQNHKIAYGFDTAGLADNVTGAVKTQAAVAKPLASPSGMTAFIYFPNNIMMYTNTPSKTANEDFMTYYYQHMKPLWTMNTGIGLPPLTSIANTPQVHGDPNTAAVYADWIPVYKTWAAPGGTGLFYNVANSVDGASYTYTFAQSLLSGAAKNAKSLLSSFQNQLEGSMK